MSLFPKQFVPRPWKGSRAGQYDLASDAFQQLLGDALHGHFYARAHIASTSGRDGSIDAWVDGTAQADGQFVGFEFPLLVECKHHDDQLAQTAVNINQGWAAVRKKLLKQANEGWPGLYAPWKKARAYLYCISARFPHQQARDDLQKEIRAFFTSLPIAQRPPLVPEQIRVWDWSDLCAWFDTQIVLRDHWLGLKPGRWIDHMGRCKQLRDAPQRGHLRLQTYLLEENLPFIAPPPSDVAHPRELLDALGQGDHILLVGEGGIGKTRALHEVAELALKQGWRVLHLLPSEEGLDLTKAAETLLSGRGNTLILIDYIDQLAGFDALYWSSTLLPEARDRGVQLHLLTNARPSGSTESLGRLRDSGLFREVPMRPNAAQRLRVTASIEDRLCPTAIAQIGRTAVQRHCGPRPIIAMFIAQALEKLALAGELKTQQANLPPPDDLLKWLRCRQREAGLLPQKPATSRWELPPPPPRQLIAIAAGLAVCPFPASEFSRVIDRTLQGDEGHVAQIVATLEEDGWIELGDDGLYRTPHDTIADEILRQVLDAPEKVMSNLLVSAEQGRPLGRFALSLGRLSGEGVLPDVRRSAIEASASEWLRVNARSLGQTLPHEDPDVVAYALGALFDYQPWHLSAKAVWEDLVTPWLESHGGLSAARHFIHRGLKSLGGDILLEPAMDWLDLHETKKTAQHVLVPLLEWDEDRLGIHQERVLRSAVAWSRRWGAQEQNRMLVPLLDWGPERLGVHHNAVLSIAIAWLERYPQSSFAGRFILPRLLRWGMKALADNKDRVLFLALGWVTSYSTQHHKSHLLTALLEWEAWQLGEHVTSVVALAVQWLESREDLAAVEISFLLHPLMKWRPAELGTREGAVSAAALRWLEYGDNAVHPSAGYVLPGLLRWRSLPVDKRRRIDQLAIAWMGVYLLVRWDATHVLSGLLEAKANDATSVDTEAVIVHAEQWLDAHRANPERIFVIARLLSVRALSLSRWQCLAEEGLSLLEQQSEDRNDSYILRGVLSRLAMLSTSSHKRWIALVVRWIGCAKKERHVGMFIYSCRYQLDESYLEWVRPALDAAVQAREGFEPYDWSRPMRSSRDSFVPQ